MAAAWGGRPSLNLRILRLSTSNDIPLDVDPRKKLALSNISKTLQRTTPSALLNAGDSHSRFLFYEKGVSSWWEKWTKYTGSNSFGFGATSIDPPGPVETTREENEDTVTVSFGTWEQLVRWYAHDGEDGDLVLRLRFSRRKPNRVITRHFLQTTQMTDVLSAVSAEPVMSCRGADVYLFDPVTRRDFFLGDSRTLLDLHISENAVFCLLAFVQSPPHTLSTDLCLQNTRGRKAGKIGLANLGNTCYMNSSLQCLLHTPELMHYFLTQNYVQDVRPSNPDGCEGRFADQFYKLMKRAWDSEQDYFHPHQFWDILSKYYPLFAEKDQHDTAELAETVLDGLMEDCNLASIPKPYFPEVTQVTPNQLISFLDQGRRQCIGLRDGRKMGRSTSFITDHFHGQYRILTRCPECDFTSRKFDSFTVLHLGLPPPKMRIVAFTLIKVCGDQLPQKFAVELPSGVLVKELYQRTAELLQYEEEKPWNQLCFVLNRTPLIFLQLQDPIARISDFDEVLLYSYQGSDYGPNSGGHKTCFIHQKLIHYSTYCYYSLSSHRAMRQEFGYPLVLWLPSDADLSSKKRSMLQGIGVFEAPFMFASPVSVVDILETSLRPFKRHMAAVQEEETKHLDAPVVTEIEASDTCSRHRVQPDPEESPQPSSPKSDLDDLNEHAIPEDEQPEEEHIPDAEETVMYGPTIEYSETMGPSTQSATEKTPVEVEMTELPLSNTSAAIGPSMPDIEEFEMDYNIGRLFDDPDNDDGASRAAAFVPSTGSSPVLRFGACSPSEAYKLTETKVSPRADEARTIVIDWDTNADQYYNLDSLERPLIHRSAAGVEERRRKTAESVTIYDCLHHEFSPHPCALDGDNLWKCGECNKMVNGVKSMHLWKTPDILLIGLKRFDYCEARSRLIKLNQMVDFPIEGLDLRQYHAPVPNDDAIYDLYGVCHHHGHGPKVGHYTSSVKSPGGRWHKYNDSWVTETTENFVVNQDAYLLYYRKRGLPFPSETEILDMFSRTERRQFEDQAVKLYQSQLARDDIQGTSDDDGTGVSTFTQFGKTDTYNNKLDNGSNSSNEMNNENDVTAVSTQGRALLLTVEAGPSSPRESSSAFFRSQNQSVILATETGELQETWPTENDDAAVDQWNRDGLVEDHDETKHELPSMWTRNRYDAFASESKDTDYDPEMFDSFQDGKPID